MALGIGYVRLFSTAPSMRVLAAIAALAAFRAVSRLVEFASTTMAKPSTVPATSNPSEVVARGGVSKRTKSKAARSSSTQLRNAEDASRDAALKGIDPLLSR